MTSTTTGVTFPADVSEGHNYDGTLQLDEGDTFTYTVEMDDQPDGDVTVDTSYASGGAMSVSPSSLTFTRSGEASEADKWEWDDPRTVTITALTDADNRDEYRTIKHEVTVDGEDYVVGELKVNIRDSSLPRLVFDPADRAVSVNEGATTTYKISLHSDPGDGATATVEISIESGPFDDAITLWTDELTFTGGATGNWNTPQTVTITGRNDDDEFDDLPELEHILIVGSGVKLGPNVYVTVVDGNRAPYFVDGGSTTRTVDEDAGQGGEVGDPVEALDLNSGDTLTYTLEDTSGKFSVDGSTGQITVADDDSLDYETARQHEFKVIVRDAGDLSDTIDVTVLVRDVDEPPEISGDTSPAFNENASITTPVARYTARDPEGGSSTYNWSVEGADASSFAIDGSGNLRFNSQPDHEVQDTYDISVVAADTNNPSDRGELAITVTVTDVNEAPEVVGDSSETYQETRTHPVATFGYIDPEGDDVTWSLAGTDRGDFSIAETSTGAGELQFVSTPDYERPADSGGDNVYNITVVATDDGTPARVGRLDVAVTVSNLNEPPSTPTGRAAITVAENTTGNLSRYSSSDPDAGDTVRWGVSGTDADAFRIDSSGNLAFDGAPDYETPTDSGRNNVYEIKVDAKDASFTSSFDVTVTVTPVDEPPVITGATTFANWQENNASAIHTYTAIDPEGNTPITWSLGGTDRGDFTITGGVLEFAAAPDFERPADSGGNNHYETTVQATDSNNKRSEVHVDVIVQNVDEPPVLTGPDTVNDFPENSALTRQVGRYTATDPEQATVTLTLTGADSDEFTLAGNGVVTFKASPDYEDDASYAFTVRAVVGSHTIDKPVTVSIQNLEETGTVTLSSVQPQVDTGLTATLEDDDVPTGTTWQWYRTSSRGSSGSTIAGATSASYTPGADDVGSYLRAVASYDDGFSDGKTAAAVSVNRVQVETQGNVAPVFPADGDYDRNIRENMRAGTNLGAPVTATDANSDRLTYVIEDSGYFEIDQSSGQLRTRVELDHEDQASHTLAVSAIDPSGADDEVDVTITVEDMDETPVVSGPARPEIAENSGTEVATYTATDPDNEGIQWVLSGTDSEDFSLSSGGILSLKEVPNYEAKSQYRISVEAHEQGGGTSVGRLSVTVQVTNVDEAGAIEVDVSEPRVGQRLTPMVVDPDGGVTSVEWKWETQQPGGDWTKSPRGTSQNFTPTREDSGGELRVVAIYRDSHGPGKTHTHEFASPVVLRPYFDSDTATRSIRENTAEGQSVGARFTAHHPDKVNLDYSVGGTDQRFFTIDPATGQLRTSSTPLDYEGLTNHQAEVDVTATAPDGQTATIAVTVAVTDECQAAGEPPCRPTVTAVSATSLRVSWSAPSADSHDLRYRESNVNAPWTQVLNTGAGRSHTISGLTTGTEYEVQVRTVNGGSPSAWSPSGRGTPRTPPPPPVVEEEEDEEEETTTTTNTGGGGGSGGGGIGGFAFGGFGAPTPAPQRPALTTQRVEQVFQQLSRNSTLVRVWRLERTARSHRWVFYDPDPVLRPFNTLRFIDLASEMPTVVAVNVTRQQRFRGMQLFRGWNYVPITQQPLIPAPGAGEQSIRLLFENAIRDGTLERIWWLDSRAQEWKFFDPDPELAAFNTLSTVDLASDPPTVVAVNVSRGQRFRGQTLFRGWNYVVLR